MLWVAIVLSSPVVVSAAPALSFSGNTLKAVEVTPERNTGLDKIYVLYDVKGVSFSVPVVNINNARIYRYSNLGGAYAEEINSVVKRGSELVLETFDGDLGYIVEDGDNRYYFWIVNYEPARFNISTITAAAEQDCDHSVLLVEGTGAPIHYYTINGQQRVLDREIRVEYDTQEWSEESSRFETVGQTKMLESLSSRISVSPPAYCSTAFKISGDKFLAAWNWTEEAESSVITPYAVAIRTTAEQEGDNTSEETRSRRRISRADNTEEASGEDVDNTEDPGEDASNQIRGEEGGLGGSAPATIFFRAFATEGVIHHEWQMSSSPEFEEVDYRFNQQDLDYTFTEEGTFYLRYIGSNFDGSCEAIGDTYTVNIGGSELLCPNAFTPDGDGVNDKWKVAYRSLLEFKCWIFDRYGHQMCYFDDPSEGWDGMRGDKPVKTGVYYYVIQAVGADGKKYKKSGDINIIRHVDRSGENQIEN